MTCEKCPHPMDCHAADEPHGCYVMEDRKVCRCTVRGDLTGGDPVENAMRFEDAKATRRKCHAV